MTTPKLPPLPEQIKALIDAEMAEYRDGAYSDHSSARDQLERFAYAIAAIQAQGVPDVQRTRNLLARYENQWHRMGELWERCQGKGWPEAESKEFAMLRDELTPATRNLLLASAPPAPQASVTQQDPTDDQIMATVGRKGFGFSDSRPLGQQWSQVCDLIRAVVSERCTHPAQQAKPDRVGMTYYKKDGCKAPSADHPDCICWKPAPQANDCANTPYDEGPFELESQAGVGDSNFEAWFSTYDHANKGNKQRARDAYAAGMDEQVNVVQQGPVAWLYTSLSAHQSAFTGEPKELFKADCSPLYTHPAQPAKPPEWYAIWIHNNYQDYPNIQSLCDALIAAANAPMEE